MTTEHDKKYRWPITISIMLATIMNALDQTIANVALPHIQGSVSAGADQITWVLTSYIVASAIATPLSGWLADRIGRKQIFLISIGGFTVTSMLCGLATSLPQIVLFRLLQGAAGAALIPLSQAVLVDIHPLEKRGQAMSIWGAGTMIGPIMGPVIGGYLTETLSWRWCFYVNLPVGILAFLGVWVFFSGERLTKAKRFDVLGFGAIAVFVAAFQLMLDRGPIADWFHSPEIWTYAALAAGALWVFVIHTMTTANPFFDIALFRDGNFVAACIFATFISIMMFSTMAVLPSMMQVLMGYPALTAGLVSLPRGIGSFLAMTVVGRLIGRVDTRVIVFAGLSFSGVSLWQMMDFDLAMTKQSFVIAGLIQGFSLALMFVPLSALAFATLPPRLRFEASAAFALIRSLGAAGGISVVNALIVANTQAMHASMAAKVIASDPVVRDTLPRALDPTVTTGALVLNGEITRQATMVAYLDAFRLMFIMTLICIPMLLFMRPPKPGGTVIQAAVD
jgi:DHA2 family multidrug resistance protein